MRGPDAVAAARPVETPARPARVWAAQEHELFRAGGVLALVSLSLLLLLLVVLLLLGVHDTARLLLPKVLPMALLTTVLPLFCLGLPAAPSNPLCT